MHLLIWAVPDHRNQILSRLLCLPDPCSEQFWHRFLTSLGFEASYRACSAIGQKLLDLSLRDISSCHFANGEFATVLIFFYYKLAQPKPKGVCTISPPHKGQTTSLIFLASTFSKSNLTVCLLCSSVSRTRQASNFLPFLLLNPRIVEVLPLSNSSVTWATDSSLSAILPMAKWQLSGLAASKFVQPYPKAFISIGEPQSGHLTPSNTCG